jgi:hypothetical protein
MEWAEIRRMQPDAWVLVEALRSRTDGLVWVLEDMALIQVFSDAADAWKEYEVLHKAKPDREFWVFSTNWQESKVKEWVWLGIRVPE